MTLSCDIHGRMGWRRARGYGFARDIGLVPMTGDELPRLAQDMPVAFRKLGTQWQAVAVLGPVPGVNLQVQADGCWRGGCVPGLLRSYPFQLSADRKALAFWPDYWPETLGVAGIEPFFVDGQLSPVLAAALVFLQDRQQAIDRLGLVLSWLAERDLLQPWQVPDVVETAHLTQHADLFAVDRDRLAALDEADWLALNRIMPVCAVLGMLHAQVSSLNHAQDFKLRSRDLRGAAIRRIGLQTRLPQPRNGALRLHRMARQAGHDHYDA